MSMPIRRMTEDTDVEVMMSIITQHETIQALPKETMFVIKDDPTWNSTNIFLQMLKETIHREDTYHLGHFSNDGKLLTFIRFKFWNDPDTNKKSWTAGAMWRNKDVVLTHSYGQKYFPDQLIDVHNHGVHLAESMGMTTGYTLSPNAVPGRWYKLLDISGVKPDGQPIVACGPLRYRTETVEEITGGKISQVPKFVANISNLPISTNQKIYKFTKLEN